MNNNTKQEDFQLSQLSKKTKNLITEIKELFKKNNLDISELKDDIDAKKTISIVFAGEYSSGKSTIIKMLTGRDDIDIGAGINTNEVTGYNWNGLEVVDTPGIKTGLRPEHDKMSYQAIAQADMLVYVITHELFDNCIGQDFRILLNDKHKGKEMILVVNKMGDVENTPQAQAVKIEDLRKVTEPYSPEELHTTFIDAKSYVNRLSYKGYEKQLEEESNYHGFVKTLNNFVKEKRLTLRLTTPLSIAEHLLDKAIEKYQPSTGDNDFDKMAEYLRQEKYNLRQTQYNIDTKVNGLINACVSEITKLGIDVSEKINNCTDESSIKAILRNSYNKTDELSAQLEKDIQEVIKTEDKNCLVCLEELNKKSWVRSLNDNLQRRVHANDSVVVNFIKKGYLQKAGQFLGKATVNTAAQGGGMLVFSGSQAHSFIKTAGHFFGKTFKPWEAVKLTKNLNNAGKFLGVFGVILTVFIVYKEDKKEREMEKQKAANRIEIRTRFDQSADCVEQHFKKQLDGFLMDSYGQKIKELDKKIQVIQEMRKGKSETCKQLEHLQQQCLVLIDEIQRTNI